MTKSLADLQRIHRKQADWLARNPGNAERKREHANLSARIASMQATEVSFELSTGLSTSKRAPPGKPDRSVLDEPVSHLANEDHSAAIAVGLVKVEEMSQRITILDDELIEVENQLQTADDKWDIQELTERLERLADQRSVAWWQMAQAAGDVHALGGYALDAGTTLSAPHSAVQCVADHMPGLLTGRTWQALTEVAH